MNSIMIEGIVKEIYKDSFLMKCEMDSRTAEAMSIVKSRAFPEDRWFLAVAGKCSRQQLETLKFGQKVVVTGLSGGAFAFRPWLSNSAYVGCSVLGIRAISVRIENE